MKRVGLKEEHLERFPHEFSGRQLVSENNTISKSAAKWQRRVIAPCSLK